MWLASTAREWARCAGKARSSKFTERSETRCAVDLNNKVSGSTYDLWKVNMRAPVENVNVPGNRGIYIVLWNELRKTRNEVTFS